MTTTIRKAFIVYLSPAGSTAHVARVMERGLRSLETPATMIDLGREPDLPFILSQLPAAKDNICLYIGSPVYASHAVPPVMEFISRLPWAEKGCAVPFVTWGGVTSGIALHRMGKALQERGYRILGAAKILARHSLMWAVDAPLGENHPDAGDDRLVEELVEGVNAKIQGGDPVGLPLSALAYQPEEILAQMEKTCLETAKAGLPSMEVDMEACIQCGVCLEECPVEAITLLPHPRFGPSCIRCFNCVRLCPEGALKADLYPVFVRIRTLAEQFRETPPSRIFL